ncbi:FxSxx-COOH system tetratricopeptide repeat protein [Saccharothrix lopnurensis]|uniref:FxSxx-COOH system tetratricopeptide repeat protein n=1 Tax=Saccharothrix lopnurensis TaxID=1670621 RepID=A0ABW1P585_9PSEU
MGALDQGADGRAATGPGASGWTPDRVREALAPLVGRAHGLVVAVDDGPAMAIWAPTVDEVVGALRGSGVFGSVTTCAFGPDETGRVALRDPDAGHVLEPAGRPLVLVLTDAVDPGWRSGPAWAGLRELGAAHSVAVASPLSWSMARRTGLDLHRVRLRAPEPGAPNTAQEWAPQADVPGLYDALGDVVPVCFTGLGPPGLRRWAELTAATGWTDAGAALVPAGEDPAGVEPARRGEPLTAVRLVAAYRASASRSAAALAVHFATAPLEVALLARIQEHLLPDAGPAAVAEFLGGPLVVPPARDARVDPGRARFDFAVEGVREELLAHGRRSETERVFRLVREYLYEHEPEIAATPLPADEELVRTVGPVIAAPRHVVEVDRAVHRALSGIYLRYSTPTDPAFPARGDRGKKDGTGVLHSDERDRTLVRTGADGDRRNAGGVDVTSTVDREERSKSLTAPVFGGLPPRNPNFTGRTDLLEELGRRLVRGSTAAVLPEALHGMGGVGKSQLAIEYAYRNRAKFDVVWWIPAERSVKIVDSLVELGQRLELNVGSEANVAVQQVLDALRSGNHPKVPANWLLIFDNADSPGAVQRYLPTGGTGRILVTSRNSQWLSVARPLEVDVFRRAESVQLLRRRDPDLTEVDAGRLAEALGDLPLAVAQAAAWRVETGMPAAEYLELLAEKQLELLDVTTTLDYPKSVAAMWDLSLSELKRKNPSALRLLQMCAFLAPEPINRTMFTYNSRNIVDVPPELSRVLRDRLRLSEAIRDIHRFALVRVDHRTNSIELHRLVQAVLISQMNEDERATMRHAAHQMLAANDPESPTESDSWRKYADLSAHLAASDAYECESEGVRALLYNQVQFLYYWGEHNRSLELSERIYRIWVERLGEEHQDTLRMGRWYGFMLWVQGLYAEAASLNQVLVERHRDVFGEEHEETIAAISAVAADKRAKGDFPGALELSRGNYELCVRYLGDDDPMTLNEAHNLGVSLRLAGDYRSAYALDVDTWDRKVQMYGQEHEMALLTQISLTLDKRELGDYHEARVEHEEIVRAYQRQSEERPLNPMELRAVRHLAAMRRKAGDHEGAMAAADTAFEGLKLRYGLDHADTLAAALAKSIEMRHLGRHGKAAQLAQETLIRYAKTLGPEHPHTLAAAVNVAILRRLAGDPQGARELDENTLESFRARLGPDHPFTLITTINLASDLHDTGDAQRAFELGGEVLRRAVEVFGADHPTTLTCQANLAQDLRSLGREEEADALHQRTLDALRDRLGDRHPVIAHLDERRARANCDIDPMPL